MEAEYISLYTAAKQAAWVRQIFGAIGHPYNQSIDIYCDSQAAIKVANQEGTTKQRSISMSNIIIFKSRLPMKRFQLSTLDLKITKPIS
jgi:hypothetical protein